jgi:hypothetical protein
MAGIREVRVMTPDGKDSALVWDTNTGQAHLIVPHQLASVRACSWEDARCGHERVPSIRRIGRSRRSRSFGLPRWPGHLPLPLTGSP